MEFPTFGSADLRTPALHVRYADGSRITRLTYDSHRVLDGKPALEGLPATYAEAGDDVQTLEITLRDTYSGLRVVLSYSVFGTLDAITRSVPGRKRRGQFRHIAQRDECLPGFSGAGIGTAASARRLGTRTFSGACARSARQNNRRQPARRQLGVAQPVCRPA